MPAPVPVFPNATGDLVAPKGCDDPTHGALDLGKPTQRDAPAARLVDVPERVVATQLVWPKAAGTKIPQPDRASIPDLPGHTLPVYRPPRA
jgi:hypothetical protein